MEVKFFANYNIADDKTYWLARFKDGEEMKIMQALSLDDLLEGLRPELVKDDARRCRWHGMTKEELAPFKEWHQPEGE